ncbi:MAG: RidA family protein [Gammaproteobacteria bacterium]|nr:RidA family protein [Gammaproteobacteria bacterium]
MPRPFEPIHTDAAPAAIGPYSQAVKCGDLVFLSGQIPLDPATGTLVSGDIDAQISQVFDNLEAVAVAAGGSLAHIVKLSVFLIDLAHFGRVNAAMEARFKAPYPARAAIGVAALPKGASVEVEAILNLAG